MGGMFLSLEIARKAIWASRLNIDVTNHNIANVNTPGYSRQQAIQSAANPLQLPQGQLGLGVTVNSLTRIRSTLLDRQFRDTSSTLSNANIKESLYSQIESVIQEPSEESIGSLMTEFFSEFSSLAADPENMALRNTLKQKAGSLVDSFHLKHDQLQQTRQAIKSETVSAVKQINEISRQIAELNGQITTAEAGGSSANDLRDRRDLLLDNLSEYVKISYTEDSRGQLNVSTEGINLVSGKAAKELEITSDSESGNMSLQMNSNNGGQQNILYGKLGALMEQYNQTIPGLIEKLDSLASGLAEQVNRLHRAGQGLATGEPPTTSTGKNFFSGNSSATLQISSEIMDDVSNIAASGDGSAGNGDVALAISNIRNQKIFANSSQTLDDYYTNMVNDIGLEVQKAQNTSNSQELLKNQMLNRRDAESGVSLDEEMTNLIQYQRSFEAAAKVVQVVDEMLQTLVDMV